MTTDLGASTLRQTSDVDSTRIDTSEFAVAPQRKNLHIDMDAFYASLEQRDNPELRGRPLAVGYARERGVVAAASYEARKFGIHSAMPSVTAKRQCPELIFVPPRFDVYRAVSEEIRRIFSEYTPTISNRCRWMKPIWMSRKLFRRYHPQPKSPARSVQRFGSALTLLRRPVSATINFSPNSRQTIANRMGGSSSHPPWD